MQRLPSHQERYIGKSTETKPVLSWDSTASQVAPMPEGSTVFENDTGNLYEWDGSAWKIATSAASVLQLDRLLHGVSDMLLELRGIRIGIERLLRNGPADDDCDLFELALTENDEDA